MKELLASLKKIKPVHALLLLLFLSAACALALKGTDAAADLRTDAEKRAESVLSEIKGAGRVRVVLYTQDTPSAFSSDKAQCVGAVLVAQGAGDPAVRIRLLSAACTLFSLPADCVEILPMEAAP